MNEWKNSIENFKSRLNHAGENTSVLENRTSESVQSGEQNNKTKRTRKNERT